MHTWTGDLTLGLPSLYQGFPSLSPFAHVLGAFNDILNILNCRGSKWGVSVSKISLFVFLCLVCGPHARLMLSCHFGLVSQIMVINANSQREL